MGWLKEVLRSSDNCQSYPERLARLLGQNH